ncbi:MAG: capsular exopolysaccharide biosynthesis protein [Gemmataceae bacterium]|nr:capsular exopolysaccharide biosynthesis protein [Gemmataceae bacterium]
MPVECESSSSEVGAETLSESSQRTGRMARPGPSSIPPDDWPGRPPDHYAADPRLVLRILRHRWKLIVGVGLIGAALVLPAVVLYLPRAKTEYTAFALVRLEPTEVVPGTGPGRPETRDLRTQAELVKTRFVLQAALLQGPAQDLPAVRDKPDGVVKRLAEELKVDIVSPQILRITLAGSDPQELPVLVNAVKDAYLREVVEAEAGRRVKRKDFLTRAADECEKRLAALRGELAEGQKAAAGTGSVDDRLSLERFRILQNELFRTELELQRSRVHAALQSRPRGAEPVDDALVDGLALQDPIVQQGQGQVDQLTRTIGDWEQTMNDPGAHPKYLALKKDRHAALAAVEARKAALREQYVHIAGATRGKQAADIRDRAARLEEEERLIRGMVERGWEEIRRRDGDLPGLKLKRYEIERLEGISKQALDELEGLRLQGDAGPRSAGIQDATDPAEKTSYRQALRLGLAGFGPFALVLVGVVVRELLVRRIYSSADVRDHVRARVLGTVPDVSRLRGPTRGRAWPTAWSQSIDRIGAAVRHELGAAGPKVLMVTSASPREGKSTFARELAASLARGGARTLLLDGDLFRPTVHRAFGIPVGPGFSELIRREVSVSDAVRPDPTSALSLLPAGAVCPRAFEELARGSLEPVFAELRTRYDMIVVDTSPVLATSLPLVIGRHADAVVLSVVCTVSRAPYTREAIAGLLAVAIPVTGVVVNGTSEADRYGYYYHAAGKTPPPVPGR